MRIDHDKISINELTSDIINFNIKNFVQKVLDSKHVSHGFFEFNFIDNDSITKINKKYLKKEEATDVISFNLGTSDNIIGDVYISTEQAKISARHYHHSFEKEIQILIIHAILHLLNYEDYTDADRQIMDDEQSRVWYLVSKNQHFAFRRPSIVTSFWLASRGIGFVISAERHMKIHLIFSIIALALAFFFKLSTQEWFMLLLTITLVLITETINTAIEISVDLTTKKRKLRAMLSKDIAAGAVLIASLNAIIVGYLLFFKKIINLILGGI